MHPGAREGRAHDTKSQKPDGPADVQILQKGL